MDILKCEYCGKEKKEVSFFIGASPENKIDWTMVEGTGKITCPDCYGVALEEREKALKAHIEMVKKGVTINI